MSEDIVGLIPAGGTASRLPPLPCSKEILPIGLASAPEKGVLRVASFSMLESMRTAGVRKAYWILRHGKWDIPSYFGSGSGVGLPMAYLVTKVPYGVPFTLQEAAPFVGRARIVFGFPDILFHPRNAYARLLEKQRRSGADVTLGLFAVDRPEEADVVECDDQGAVRRIYIKSDTMALNTAWMLAVWTPAFTDYMSKQVVAAAERIDVERRLRRDAGREQPFTELYIGDVFQAAIDDGFKVDSVFFPEGRCLDIGTPAGLLHAMRDDVDATTRNARN